MLELSPSRSTAVTRLGTQELIHQPCPACGKSPLRGFYAVRGVPAHSVLRLTSQEEALGYPKGDIHLAFCWQCGFITNVAFDPALNAYSERYEETQAFSPTFNAFSQKLAEYLIERFELHGKTILEIGCGKGDFLALLCELGPNRGFGFDPAFIPERAPIVQKGQVTYIADFYSERYADIEADFYLCKMTLEHIQPVAEFVSMVRQAIGERHDAVVFFQIPEMSRILKELAFWDIYYEHCSYFTAGSLGRLFRRCGFNVLDLWVDFDDQYLMIEAVPWVGGAQTPPLKQEEDMSTLLPLTAYFAQTVPQRLQLWRSRLKDFSKQKKRVILWGGGSKAVAFLTTLGIQDEVAYVVDVNPHKDGTYIAGTGHPIVSPDFVRVSRPDIVIVMNPVYMNEIRQMLSDRGLSPTLLAVNA